MYPKYLIAALAGFSSIVTAAPAHDTSPIARGLRWKSQKRSPLTIVQNVVENSITIVQQNLDVIDGLTALAEQQFAALVQSQLALVTQLQTIKDNIRINHFKSRFSTVNTVIVTVSCVVDQRDPNNIKQRYLVNQLLADNGFPDKQIPVIVTDLETMTIASTPTEVSNIFGAAATAASTATATPILAGFDPNAPFGQLNQSIILPIGALAPTLQLVFSDPAAIIFPNQNNLFVESVNGFLADCGFYANNANNFLNLATGLFASFNQIAAAELAGLAGFNLFGSRTSSVVAQSSTATQTATKMETSATATPTK